MLRSVEILLAVNTKFRQIRIIHEIFPNTMKFLRSFRQTGDEKLSEIKFTQTNNFIVVLYLELSN